jgi:hypothetical protein
VPHLKFTQHLQQRLDAPPMEVPGATVREALDHAFSKNPQLRHYVLDDQGRLRKHVTIFVDGRMVADRGGLSDSVGESSELFVMQALSGG